MPPRIKLAKEEAQIAVAYRNGWTMRRLAQFYRVAPGTIRNTLFRQGELVRKRGRRKGEKNGR